MKITQLKQLKYQKPKDENMGWTKHLFKIIYVYLHFYLFSKLIVCIYLFYSLGAVQQEARIARAVEIMLMYVDNLKRNCEREHTELEESRKLLAANNLSVEDQWRSNSGLEVSFILRLEKILKGSLYLIPSPSPSVNIQILGGKFAWAVKAKYGWVL